MYSDSLNYNLTDCILEYDGSFDGFLCAVHEFYLLKLNQVEIQKEGSAQGALFAKRTKVITQLPLAEKVWKRFKVRIGGSGCSQIFRAFLSEEIGVENILLRYIQHALNSSQPIHSDFSHPDVLKVSQMVKSVGREKHRMEAFVRFRRTKDGIYFAHIAPDFNVLPLISKHFQERYADQKWMIYDENRHYALYYDLNKVEVVELHLKEKLELHKNPEGVYDEQEIEFQELWKDYFKSTNIKSRKNDKLHTQHVPKRYWRYLTEKLPGN